MEAATVELAKETPLSQSEPITEGATKTEPETSLEKTNQYLLVEDSNDAGIPLHLEQLFAKYDALQLRQSETLFLLTLLIALETAFVPLEYLKNAENSLNLQPTIQTSSFSAANVKAITGQPQAPNYNKDAACSYFSMELQQYLHFFTQKNKRNLLDVSLVAIVSGDAMLVTLTPLAANEKQLHGFSISLSIARYVHNTDSVPIQRRFQNLPELSQRLRDGVFFAMRMQLINFLSLGPFPGLAGLPTEVYDRIMDLLKRKDRTSFASLNQRLHFYCIHSKYWRKVKKLTFNIDDHTSSGMDDDDDVD